MSVAGWHYNSASDPVSAAEMAKINALQSVQGGQYAPFTVFAIGQGGEARYLILKTVAERNHQDDLNH